jgi:hypothetical protein
MARSIAVDIRQKIGNLKNADGTMKKTADGKRIRGVIAGESVLTVDVPHAETGETLTLQLDKVVERLDEGFKNVHLYGDDDDTMIGCKAKADILHASMVQVQKDNPDTKVTFSKTRSKTTTIKLGKIEKSVADVQVA